MKNDVLFSLSPVVTPLEESVGAPSARVTSPNLDWKTPGSVLAQNLRGVAEIRMILERMEPDRYSVFVVLDSDPEAVLDRIFETEASLYREFPKMPFDVRVTTPSPNWDPGPLMGSTIAWWVRP
jgi:hypothetical protein